MTVKGLKIRKPEPDHRRTHQRVRRRSRLAGGEKWRALTRQEARRHVLAAEKLAKVVRKKGQRHGAPGTLSRIALKVYELLCNLAVVGQGRVEPSIAYMSEQIAATTRSIVRALQQLRDLGLLDWARRYVETDGAGHGRGPQVEQTTNAYWVKTSARAHALIGVKYRAAPAPLDFEAARAERAAQIRAYAQAQEEDDSPAMAKAAALARAGFSRRERDVP